MKDSINLFLRVRKEDVYALCPFFESFEGMAAIRTPKPAAGSFTTLKLMVSPDFLADYEKLLAGLKGKFWFERLTPLIPLSISDGEGETLNEVKGGGED